MTVLLGSGGRRIVGGGDAGEGGGGGGDAGEGGRDGTTTGRWSGGVGGGAAAGIWHSDSNCAYLSVSIMSSTHLVDGFSVAMQHSGAHRK